MTVYQIDVPDDLWDDWKETVPRSKNLNDRVVELIEEDTTNAN
jgi:hypothetical protein